MEEKSIKAYLLDAETKFNLYSGYDVFGYPKRESKGPMRINLITCNFFTPSEAEEIMKKLGSSKVEIKIKEN